MEPKRLYRSLRDRKLAGVAGGLGEYLAVDPLLIRLLFIILFFVGGGGLLIYIIFWIVTPEAPYPGQAATPPPPADPSGNQSWASDTDQNYHAENPVSPPPLPKTPPEDPETGQAKGSLIGGLVLITLGGIFLADEFIPCWDFGDLWPLVLVVIGAGLLINALTRKKSN